MADYEKQERLAKEEMQPQHQGIGVTKHSSVG